MPGGLKIPSYPCEVSYMFKRFRKKDAKSILMNILRNISNMRMLNQIRFYGKVRTNLSVHDGLPCTSNSVTKI